MENYPYAIFTFKKKVKTLEGHLSGQLKEEKDFFKESELPELDNLKELTDSSHITALVKLKYRLSEIIFLYRELDYSL